MADREWKMGYPATLVCQPPDPLERVDTPPDIAEALRRRAGRIRDLETENGALRAALAAFFGAWTEAVNQYDLIDQLNYGSEAVERLRRAMVESKP